MENAPYLPGFQNTCYMFYISTCIWLSWVYSIWLCIDAYIYIPWTSRPWEFPGSMGIHGVFRENTVHLIFQVFFPAWSGLESIMQYKITHNPDMWCQGSCGCQMQILNFYTSDLSGDVRGWKKTNKNSPILTHANPWKTLGICMCLHGFFMGIAWVQHGWGIPSVFRFRNPIPGVLL